MINKLEELEKRYNDLTEKLSSKQVLSNPKMLQKYSKELSEIEGTVKDYRQLNKLKKEFDSAKELYETDNDEEMKKLAGEEKERLEKSIRTLKLEIQKKIIPVDPYDKKDIFMEIRAGTGGIESSLFASDLFRMYSRYAETKRWKIEIMSTTTSDLGGYKEIIFMLKGKEVYKKLKYESGVHRVQRVPVTEASGRIHTSAVTVAVLPEAEEVDIEIDPNDLKIDCYRSSGPGGQSVNTTDSAVRITHLPTGIVVCCQDEKSQHKNKTKGMKVLRARLLSFEKNKQREKIAEDRKSQVGTGDRSERIRTYNYPQNRLTDHRISLTLYDLENILDGSLDKVIDELIEKDIAKKIENL